MANKKEEGTPRRRSNRLLGIEPPTTPSVAAPPAAPKAPRKKKDVPPKEPESPTPHGRKRKEPEPDPEPATPEPRRRGHPRKAAPAEISTPPGPDPAQPAPATAATSRRPATNPYTDRGADRAAAEARPRGVFQIGGFTIGAPSITVNLPEDAPPAPAATIITNPTGPQPPGGEYNPAEPTSGYAAAERHFRAARERAAAVVRAGPEYDPNDPAAGMPEAVWRYQAYGEFRLYCLRPDRLRHVPNPRHFPDPFW